MLVGRIDKENSIFDAISTKPRVGGERRGIVRSFMSVKLEPF
jgi:hypothetical protein